MPRSSANEIIEGYIEEVKSYIPSLIQGIKSLREQPDQNEALEETHRLVHTIKGASAMVGIHGLSHVACQMEDALDDMLSGKLVFDDRAFQAMSRAIDHFQAYCTDFADKGVEPHVMLRETVSAFRRVRGLPAEGDETALGKLLAIVPVREGGRAGDEPRLPDEISEAETEDGAALSQLHVDFDMESDEPVFAVPPKSRKAEKQKNENNEPDLQQDQAHSLSDLPPELLESFYEEAEEHLQDLGRSLNTLETQVTEPSPISPAQREVIRHIRRSVHTLKGASAVVGLPNIPEFAHALEDLLDWLYEESDEIDPGIVSMMTESSDVMERMVANPRDPLNSVVGKLKDHYKAVIRKASPENRPSSDPQEEAFDKLRHTDKHTRPSDSPEFMSELLESFYEEAEEHLQDMGRSLNDLEGQVVAPGPISPPQREMLCEIRRSVHTLKGASAVVGLPNIPEFAHALEDLLDWLYEKAAEIDPDIVGVMGESADVMERMVANPREPQASVVGKLKDRYRAIIENRGPGDAPGVREQEIPRPEFRDKTESVGSVEELPVRVPAEDISEENLFPEASFFGKSRTLRVGTERVDDLVNLVGELIIATSAFDQKMDIFLNAVEELEISRHRLRDIARDTEVSYEVRALGNMGRLLHGSRTPEDSDLPLAYSGQKAGGSGTGDFEDFDTLELDRYSELSLIIRTLNEAVIDVGTINTHLSTIHSDLDGHLNRQRVILSELQDKMMRVRMTPMSVIINRLRRVVREVSAKLGKKVRLTIEGANIELDRVVWEKITDPLMHLLRNSADHGIEPPELRQAMGKPRAATIKLTASREGNQVVIRVLDDGAGLNYEAIRASAHRAGFSGSDKMNEDELAALIFEPGFSTRRKISEISGRGVGMDVVRENIQELKGSIRIKSWKDRGTLFTIRIPLTLAAVRALLFTVGRQIFAIALNEIKEIMRVDPDNFVSDVRDIVRIDDEVLQLYYLSKVLNIRKGGQDQNPVPEMKAENYAPEESAYPIVLVLEIGNRRGAFVVDTLVGQREIVIKSTGSHLRYVKGISGATIMGDGSVVPILNAEELFESEVFVSDAAVASPDSLIREDSLEIMVVDDSVSIRQVVSRLMENQGWKVRTAKDGIDALGCLRERLPDLIVLDVEMPRMNGYEFLGAVRAQPTYQNIPVVMLTSRAAAKHRDKAISLGARGFVVKPYNNNEFIDLILKLTE